MTTALITGSRKWSDRERIFKILSDGHALHGFTLLVQGGAKGADEIAEEWAAVNGVPCVTMKANWKKHGKAAGPIRNREMLDRYPEAIVYAFPLGEARGTRGCVAEAKKRRHYVVVFEE